MSAVVHENLPFAKYCELPGESASSLRRFMISPLYFRWYETHPQEETDAMRQGRAIHTAVLEPAKFSTEYAVWDGGTRRGKDWDRFVLENEPFGRTILTETQRDNAVAIASAVRSHPIAGALLAEAGKAELSITWVHPRTGLQMRARLDWLCSALCDLKSSANIEPRLFAGQVARLSYHAQLAVYRAALLQLGLDVPAKLIVVQSSPPYDCAVYGVPDDVILIGEQAYENALDRLAACRKSGVWPGIASDAELELRLPVWALDDADAEWEVTAREVA